MNASENFYIYEERHKNNQLNDKLTIDYKQFLKLYFNKTT